MLFGVTGVYLPSKHGRFAVTALDHFELDLYNLVALLAAVNANQVTHLP